MKLKFKCSCGKVLVADVSAAGKKAKCPNCGQGVTVPKPTEAMLAAAAGASAPPTQKPAAANSPSVAGAKTAGAPNPTSSNAKPNRPPVTSSMPPAAKPVAAQQPAIDLDDLGLAPLDDLPPPTTVPPSKPASPPKPPASPLKPLANSPLMPLDDSPLVPLADSPLTPIGGSPLTPIDDAAIPLDDLDDTLSRPAAQSKPTILASATSGAGGAGQSIWDETEDEDLRLSAEPEAAAPCPQCGTSMSPQAVVCMSCGYNRKTGTVLAPAPRAKEKSQAVEKLKSLFGGSKRRSSSGGGFSRGTLRIVIIAIVGGIALLFLGYNEQKLANLASAEPETISLEKLLARGPNGNINLILTDYNICSSFVEQVKMVGGVPTGDWTAVWAPIVVSPPGAQPQQVVKAGANLVVQAIVHSTHVANEQDLISKLAVGRLPGMVVNQVRSLNDKEKEILRQHYAGINFDQCIIFDEGRTPMSQAVILLIFAGGAAAVLVGIGLGVKGLVSR